MNLHLARSNHLRRTARPLQRTAIAAAVMAAAGAAHAQATPAPAPAPTDVVIVTGFRASIESALTAKREDNGIVDVIKSEDIAKFPDTNLAESLQRVPGVVIDRDAGEGRNITVRGLGSDFTRVRINGIEALATTGGTDSSGGNNRTRGFDFNVFASELFNSITVRKSSSADVDEGSLGATVDLATSRPFDFRGFTANVSVQGRYNDLAEKTNPRMAFLISGTSEDRKFGALLSAAYSKRNLYEEGFSTVRWDNGPSSGGWCSPTGVTPTNPATSTATTCGPAAQGVPRLTGTAANTAAYTAASAAGNFHPRLPRYGRLTHDQDRLGVTASLQFRPMEGTLATLDMLYSKLSATRQEDFLEAISFSRALASTASSQGGGKSQTSVVDTAYAANGALLFGTYNGVDIRAESRFDELSTEFTQPTLTIDHSFNDTLKLNVRFGQAKSRFRNPIQTTTTLDALNVNGYTIDFRGNDRVPAISYPFDVNQAGGALTLVTIPTVTSGTQTNFIANTTASEIRIRPQGSTNTNNLGHFELAWDASDQVTVRGGGDYKKYTFDSYESRRVNQNDTIFAPPAGTTVTSLTTSLSGVGSGLGIPAGTPTGWVIPNLNAIAAAYDIYCNCIKSGPAGGPGDFTLSSITNGNARGNNRKVTETDTGGYLMADFSATAAGIKTRGNFGLRYVKTDLLATGYQSLNNGTETTVNNTYSDTLPALNLAADLAKDLVLRVSAAKVMSRPKLADLNPGGSISTAGGANTITAGNPLLKPFRAKTFDTSFEWYHDKAAFVGLGLFYKNINTYVQSLRAAIPYNQTGLPMSLLPAGYTGDEVFQVTAPVNTEGGKLTGFELNVQQPFSFLPGIGRNFGVLFNYTKVQSKIEYLVSPTSGSTITDDLLNLSPNSWNTTLYYEDGKLSARVSASSRSSFLTRVPGQNNNDVEGKNSSLNVDMSISYKLTDQLSLTFEGVNLTNQASDQFISRARDSVVSNTVTGREYLFGMRYKF